MEFSNPARFLETALKDAYGHGFHVSTVRRLERDFDGSVAYRARASGDEYPGVEFPCELDERTHKLTLDGYPAALATARLQARISQGLKLVYGSNIQLALDVCFAAPLHIEQIASDDFPDSCPDSLRLMLSLFVPVRQFDEASEIQRLRASLASLPNCGSLSLLAYYPPPGAVLGSPPEHSFCARTALSDGRLLGCLTYDGPPSQLSPTPPPDLSTPFCDPLTDYDLRLISELAYQRLPWHYLSGAANLSVRQLCQRVVEHQRNHPNADIQPGPIVQALAESHDSAYANVQRLPFLGGADHNPSTGFCAIALSGPEADLAAFRGSESEDVPSEIDWVDNFGAGISGVSVQYPDILWFLSEFTGPRVWVTGHSKGGHNALYAAAADSRVIGGAAFDGQGFASGALDDRQTTRLVNSSVRNLVAETDLVGSLLYHPEDRRFIKLLPGTPPGIAPSHMLSNIAFVDGHTVPGAQSLPMKAAGLLSRRLSDLLQARLPGRDMPSTIST